MMSNNYPMELDPGRETPTTDEVRFTYVQFLDEYVGTYKKEGIVKFQRWLADVEREAFQKGVDSVNNQCSETNVGERVNLMKFHSILPKEK
jgi:hypothetical protein